MRTCLEQGVFVNTKLFETQSPEGQGNFLVNY